MEDMKPEHEDSEHDFNLQITKQTTNSLTIAWTLHEEANVYEIEKFHKKHGWESVAWTIASPQIVNNLDENFAYNLRVNVLKYNSELRAYEKVAISSAILGRTLAPLPTTICLYRAIRKGHQFVVKLIIQRRPDLINLPGPNGALPLPNAIACGEIGIVDILLMAGASVAIANPSNNQTPLHWAFYYGRIPVARMLLNKKANLDATDINGLTPAHSAVDAHEYDILKFGLDNGARMESRDACGYTLLLRAVVMRCDVDLLKLIVTHGANTKAVDDLGQSCLDLARLYKNDQAIKYFIHYFKVKSELSKMKT